MSDDDDYGDEDDNSQVGDSRGGGGDIFYIKSNKSNSMSDSDTQHVLKEIKQRTQVKWTKDYSTTNIIRNKL